MMNDSVREELQDKISTNSKGLHIEFIDEMESQTSSAATPVAPESAHNVFSSRVKQSSISNPIVADEIGTDRGGLTHELRGARRTSPILVEFQNKGAALPEWRIQMQNAVRQRRESSAGANAVSERPVLISTNTATNGATALKAETIPQQTPNVGTAIVENAVKRVEASRKKFSVHEGTAKKTLSPTPKGGARTFPIAVSKTSTVPAPSPEPLPDTSFKEIVPELTPIEELHTDDLPAIPMPEALAEEVPKAEESAPVEAIVETAETAAEVGELDEFADIELELDDEDFELAEPVLEAVDTNERKPAAAKVKSAAPKTVTLPLFPEEYEDVLPEEVEVAEVAESLEEVESLEADAPLAETAPAEIAEETHDEFVEVVVEEVAEESAEELQDPLVVEDFDEEIHETSQPEFDDEDVTYEYGDEHSQGFIDDYEYEPVADAAEEALEENVEDLAPISMRFNAGLLDLIIGAGISLLLLSPFIVSGGKWLSAPGVVAFVVTLAIVMFIYMTATVGFSGRTLGMKVFSLEVIDIEENEYPDFHQAALSSSLYLVSLALCGLGFVTALFNSERRAVHDLLSGTVIVREY